MGSKNPSENSSRPWIGARSPSDAPWNYADRRGRADRRLIYDRRELIRFETDRRTNRQRRYDGDPWAIP